MYDDKNFFCIIYGTGFGGQHLANILTANDKFYPRFPSINYLQDLELVYAEKAKLKINEKEFDKIIKKQKAINWQLIDRDANSQSKLLLAYNAHLYKRTTHFSQLLDNEIIQGTTFKNLRYMSDSVSIHASFDINKNYDNFLCLVHHFDFLKNYKASPNNLLHLFVNKLINRRVKGILLKTPVKHSRAFKRVYTGNSPINLKRQELFNLPVKFNANVLFDNENCIEIDTDLFFESEGSYYIQELFDLKYDIKLPSLIHKLHQDWLCMIDRSLEEYKQL